MVDPAPGRLTRLVATGEAPPPVSCPSAAVLGTDLYLFGGVHDYYGADRYTFHDHLYRFDTVERHWTRLAPTGPAPSPRAFTAAVADPRRGCLYVFGGTRYERITPTGVEGYQAFDELWAYQPDENRWHLLSAPEAGPAGRASPALWLAGDRLHVFGGAGPSVRTFDDLWAFDLVGHTWQQLSSVGDRPPSRLGPAHDACPATGRLLLCGGEHVEIADGRLAFTLLSDTWAFDPAGQAWTELTPTVGRPSPASYAVGALLGGALHTHGGDIPGGEASQLSPVAQNPSEQHWCLAPGGTWRQLHPEGQRLRLKCHAGGVVGGQLYLAGGYDFQDSGQSWNRDVVVYTPHQGDPP